MFKKLIERIRLYKWCKRMGIRHPWKASGDKFFISGWQRMREE